MNWQFLVVAVFIIWAISALVRRLVGLFQSKPNSQTGCGSCSTGCSTSTESPTLKQTPFVPLDALQLPDRQKPV